MLFLCGDVGGTNSRLQLFRVNGESEEQVGFEVYPSSQYDNLIDILKLFLSQCKVPTETELFVCVAVAGPVAKNRCVLTNLHWILDGEEIRAALGAKRVKIINDFMGVGYGLLALPKKSLITLNDVPAKSDAPIACLGAGTGLGEVILTSHSGQYEVWSTEGGHTDFAARTDLEFDMQKYLRDVEGITRVSVERVVSGPGIPHIYNFLAKSNPELVNEKVKLALDVPSEDSSATIAQFGTGDNPDELCAEALRLFISLYGAEAGNLALKTLCYGGLYIAGGIAPKLKELMEKGEFLESFFAKGRMEVLLKNVPVHIVDEPEVGLLGARVVCRRLAGETNKSCEAPQASASCGGNGNVCVISSLHFLAGIVAGMALCTFLSKSRK